MRTLCLTVALCMFCSPLAVEYRTVAFDTDAAAEQLARGDYAREGFDIAGRPPARNRGVFKRIGHCLGKIAKLPQKAQRASVKKSMSGAGATILEIGPCGSALILWNVVQRDV